MALGDMLCLCRAGRRIRAFPLGAAAVEVGSHPDCDIVIHAAAVPARALLFQPHGGTVYVYDLAKGPALGARSVVPIGERIAVGAGYSVARLKAECASFEPGGTELIGGRGGEPRLLSLVGGHGPGARAFHVGESPVSVGGASDNAITLSDRAVSRYHCRIEPSSRGVSIRDLGSTNGTWVDGLRIRRHELRPGAVVRIGRTELRVVRRGGKPPTKAVVESSAMLSVMAEVDRFAGLPWPVLIRGETGVGKEHVARALHERGPAVASRASSSRASSLGTSEGRSRARSKRTAGPSSRRTAGRSSSTKSRSCRPISKRGSFACWRLGTSGA
jgi:hypothetical protein